jgi:outer membrane protein TolC/preprotein translocase subunit SecF
VSFLVAILVTPLLCRFFIRRGLREQAPETSGGKRKITMLDRLQASYNVAIVFFMRHKALAMLAGLMAVLGGALMFRAVPQQFFPSAERNQFVIDVWMPREARIEATTQVMNRIERALAGRREVAHFASFTGQSAPRFYYNVNPQDPDAAYGQFIVNTVSEKETPALVAGLRGSLALVAPEALVIVKELQQGMTMDAPVEVRVSGQEIPQLRQTGEHIERILRSSRDAELVHDDYFEDSYLVDVDVNTEISNRLGLTNAVVGQTLAGGFSGAPVSTFWEGDRPVTVLLRLDPAHRASFEDVRNAYLTSPITHASVPLRSLADLSAQWQTSRIVRRNGVRTLTVRAFPKAGSWASAILGEVKPQVDSLPLPPGYRVEYGGEKTNSDETLPGMLKALAISILAIFLVLLIQFGNLSEPLIVMCSIPLTLFGAALGLLLFRNPFGFTAFTGLISLSGIVVRNSIILVDYMNEKLRQGLSLDQAATQAGERRLRPIFLTTMAAAVGVTPMIVSQSSLWSPLASVIAVGLVSSMFFTLMVVPVLFVLVKSRHHSALTPSILVVLLALLPMATAHASTRKLTLPEAVTIALKQNSALKIARAKIREQHGKLMAARSSYFPQLSATGSVMGLSDRQLVTVPEGSLGNLPGIGPFPTGQVTFNQGSTTVELANTTLAQPLTQLFRIRDGAHIAASDERISAAEARQAEEDVILAVHQLYYGLLAARKRIEVVRLQIAAGEESMREAENGVRSGSMLEVAVIGAHASLLNSKQSLMGAENQVEDLTADMNQLLGLPVDTALEVADVDLSPREPLPYEQYLAAALAENPELESARENVVKARTAVSAALDEYIPDIGAFARDTYQTGVPFLAHSFGTFGIQLNWNILDWGKRRGEIAEREAQLAEAEENVRRITDRITGEVAKAYRKLDRCRRMMEVSAEALALRRENQRLSSEQLKAGVTSEAKNAETLAAAESAELDQFEAGLAYQLAESEMAHVAGMGEVTSR